MPSINGHGPRRAILYARVSTDEQARSGYSLAQQMEALRAYATREGYEVLEEVVDPGQSGASLRNRPKRGCWVVARYSNTHEKDVSNRPLRCRVLLHSATYPCP